MNSEYGIVSRVVWRESNCFTTVRTTSPITSQMPMFFKRLFNRRSFHGIRGRRGPRLPVTARHGDGCTGISILDLHDGRGHLDNGKMSPKGDVRPQNAVSRRF